MFIIIALDSGTIVCSFELSADYVDLFLYFDRNAIGPNRLIHSSFRSGYFFFSLLVGLRWCDAELSDAMRLRWWHKFRPVRFGWITVLEIESIYFISMRLPRFETKDERGKDKKSDGIYKIVDFFVTYIFGHKCGGCCCGGGGAIAFSTLVIFKLLNWWANCISFTIHTCDIYLRWHGIYCGSDRHFSFLSTIFFYSNKKLFNGLLLLILFNNLKWKSHIKRKLTVQHWLTDRSVAIRCWNW